MARVIHPTKIEKAARPTDRRAVQRVDRAIGKNILSMMCSCFESVLLLILIFTVHTLPILNRPVPDQSLDRFQSYEYNVPSDTFKNDEETNVLLSLKSNKWLTSSYDKPSLASEFGYYDVMNLIVKDDFLFLLDMPYGLRILDISDLNSLDFPLVGQLEMFEGSTSTSYKCSFSIFGEYMFWFSSFVRFSIISIKDKTKPTHIISLSFEDSECSRPKIFATEDYVYLLCEYGDRMNGIVRIIDVRIKDSPQLSLEFDLPSYGRGISYKNDHLFFATSDGFYIYDVSNKSEPSQCWSYDGYFFLYIKVDEKGYAYVLESSSNSMFIFDSRVPCSSTYESDIVVTEYGADPIHVDVHGDFAYLTENDHIAIVNVSSKSSPDIVIWNWWILDAIAIAIVDDDTIFVARSTYGFEMVDVSTKESPVSIPLNFTITHPRNSRAAEILALDGEFLYVGGEYLGFDVMNVRREGKMTLLSEYHTAVFDQTKSIFFRGNHLYVSSLNNFVVYERSFSTDGGQVKFTEKETYLSTYSGGGGNVYIDAEEKFGLYVNFGGFDTIDLSTGEIVAWQPGTIYSGMQVTGDRRGFAYFLSSMGVFVVRSININNGTLVSSPELVSTIEFDTAPTCVYLLQEEEEEESYYLFVTTGTDGMKIVDVGDPYHPEIVGSSDTLYAQKVTVDGSVAAVSDGEGGVKLIDVIDKTRPTDIATLPVYYAANAIIKNNFVFVACGEYGLRTFQLDMKILGKQGKFDHFCGEAVVQISASDMVSVNDDYLSSTTDSFVLSRDDYCNTHGKCLPNIKCSCTDGYEGSNCETWSCHGFDFKDVSQTCNAHGDCTQPENCECQTNYNGKSCQNNVLAVALGAPLGSLAGFGVLLCLTSACFACMLCCCAFCMVIVCCFCVLCSTVLRQKKGIERFKELKNFDLLMREQELEENEDIAHLRINKDLFKISFSEIKLMKILGEGGSNSTVYKATWNDGVIAFKSFRTRTVCSDQVSFDEFEREVQILGSVNHPNILQFFGCTLDPPRVGILMEFCELGDVDHFLKIYRKKNDASYDFVEKVRFCLEICLAMSYLHARKIIHRDLKLMNVLVNKAYTCKLMDFGLSKIVDKNDVKTSKVGTSYYMAPEVLHQEYDEKVDVFSFGICVFVMMTEEYHPYGVKAEHIEIRVATDPNLRPDLSILKDRIPVRQRDCGEFLNRVASQCWDHDSTSRPSFETLSKEFRNEFERMMEKKEVFESSAEPKGRTRGSNSVSDEQPCDDSFPIISPKQSHKSTTYCEEGEGGKMSMKVLELERKIRELCEKNLALEDELTNSRENIKFLSNRLKEVGKEV